MQLKPCTLFVAALCASPTLFAQHSENFETAKFAVRKPTALNGQLGFYNPATANSTTFNSFLYAADTLKVPKNPNGGTRYVAGVGPGTVNNVLTFARSQRNTAYCGGDKWTVGFDILVQFNGTGTAAQNIGSFSTQRLPGDKTFIMLARWSTPGSAWKMSMVYFSATGTQVIADVPGTAFTGLKLNNWYRWEADFDLKTNTITETRVTDLTGKGSVTKAALTAWYLGGGQNSTLPPPNGYRLFAGSNVAGNTLAFDNIDIKLNGPGGTKAKVSNYGTGTNRPNPKGSLIVTGLPIIDTTLSVRIQNPGRSMNSGAATLLAVAGAKLDPGLRINDWGMNGGVGELLVAGILQLIPGPKWDGTNPAVIRVAVPADCAVVGLTLYVQGVMADPTSTKAQLGVTEAAEATVGNIR